MLIFFVGLKDDVVTLPPYKKIIAQVVAAFIIIFLAEIRFTNLHGLLGIGEIGMIPSIIITCFTIVVIINAINLMDGIDGLAAGLSMLATLVFGSWFFVSGHIDYAILSFTLIGAIAGFFYLNVYGKRYKIFMGDTGSLVLGTVISILVIRFNEFNIDQTQPYAIASVPAISFGILSYPLIDTLRVMIIRIIYRKSIFSADKNHLHHRLLTLGFSHPKATYTIMGFNLLFIIFIFTIHHYGLLRLTAYITLIGGSLFMVPAYFIRKRNLIKIGDPVQQLLFHGMSENKVLNKKKCFQSKKTKDGIPAIKSANIFPKNQSLVII
jgi:UDP-GlcNAc:undecaprenyl-phosphate GlcNAc-1-phosphate transferase